jgi:hypothetical protein
MASKSPGNRTILYFHYDEDTFVLIKVVFYLKAIVS